MTGREGAPAGRRELPVLCKYLRCKSAYGATEPGPPGSETDWPGGGSSTEAYWCLATMEAFGPDDDYAHATVCGAGRRCFRPGDGE